MTARSERPADDSLRERLQSALESSFVYETLATATDRLSRSSDRITTVVRASYLYGWLTEEPEPEVVVIDLRETYTVGPFIAALDRIVPPLERASSRSRLVSAVGRLSDRVTDTRGYEVTAALLQPPEPPAEDRPANQKTDDANDQ